MTLKQHLANETLKDPYDLNIVLAQLEGWTDCKREEEADPEDCWAYGWPPGDDRSENIAPWCPEYCQRQTEIDELVTRRIVTHRMRNHTYGETLWELCGKYEAPFASSSFCGYTAASLATPKQRTIAAIYTLTKYPDHVKDTDAATG